MKTLVGVLEPPEEVPTEEIVAALERAWTPALWAELRLRTLRGDINAVQWRRLWRRLHPEGQIKR